MPSNLQLILGGARSGKSGYAVAQGDEHLFEDWHFLATATAGDDEMITRIQRHQASRHNRWRVLEEPYRLPDALEKTIPALKGLVVVDCATLWISNLLCGIGGKVLTTPEVEKEFEKFQQVLDRHPGSVRVVSNEVGLGIVPDNSLSRQFQDLQGELNKSLAAIATQVIFMTAGLPRKLK